MKTRLYLGARQYELRWSRGADRSRAARCDNVTAAEALRTLTADASTLAALRRMLARELPLGSLRAMSKDAVVLQISQLLASGRLLLIEERRARPWAVELPPGAEDREATPAAKRLEPLDARSERERTWIEVQLLGEDDKPIAGERYRIQVTDGSLREGRLDAQGLVHIGDLDPGTCTVWFPDLDELAFGQVEAEARAGSEPRAASRSKEKRTWIEIELVDEEDKPIPGERYRIKLPDGSLREGTLDAGGLARVQGILPGTCQVSFPALDEDAWSPV